MMKWTCLALLCAVATTNSANAGVLSSVTSSNSGAVTVVSSSSSETGGALSTGTIDLLLDIKSKHVPVNLTFNFDARPGAVVTRYNVMLTVANALTSGNTYLNGFDIKSVAGGLTGGIDTSVTPTSQAFAVQYPGNDIGGGFRFGGLLGGGGALSVAGTSLQTFTFDVNGASAGTATMSFTANPEPGAMLLGALALIPVGVVVRRRRKTEVAVEA